MAHDRSHQPGVAVPKFASVDEYVGAQPAEVEELLRPVLCDARGAWTADYVRLRFEARAP